MSSLPEPFPPDREDAEEALQAGPSEEPPEQQGAAWRSSQPGEPEGLESEAQGAPGVAVAEPMFVSFIRPPLRPPVRFPNIADVGLVLVLLFIGWLGSGGLLAVALHFHLYGVSTVQQAIGDIHYTLGSQAIWYLVSFGGCLLLFPLVWHTSFFNGLEWRGRVALHFRWRLLIAVASCLVLALVDGLLMPGPADTPIDQIFRIPGAAWLLFGFGITLAPFFEELGFRGFLLPALCTACDWAAERITKRPAPWPDPTGHTQWSLPAIAVGSVLTSIPFAAMHAAQTGYSIGPFLLLICVSLVLCWIRLSTRSLAASVLVHSCYNFLLFTLMLAGTGGFKHLEKM